MSFDRFSSAAGLGLPAYAHERFDRAMEELNRSVLERDAARSIPDNPLSGLLAAGAGASRIPADAGGWGLSLPEHVDLLVAIARIEPGAAQAMRSHHAFIERLLLAAEPAGSSAAARAREGNGTDVEEKVARWLREAAAGRLFAGATTEPPGQRSGALGTVLRRASSGWILDGAKSYCTGAAYADWIGVLARGPEGQRLTAMVRPEQPGVTVHDDWIAIGQRASASGGVEFAGVEVAESEIRPVLPDSGAAQSLNDAFLQLTHLATLAGIGVRIHDDAVAQVRGSRRHFSHAAASVPAEDPVVQQIVGTLSARAAAAVALVESAAVTLERAQTEFSEELVAAAHRQVTQAQVIVPDLVLDSATRAFDVGGGSLVSEDRRWDRHWRNARTLASHNPAVQKARVLGAEAVLGTPLPGIWYAGEPGRDEPRSAPDEGRSARNPAEGSRDENAAAPAHEDVLP